MRDHQVELGKLMAQVETLQKQLADIKKDVSVSKKQITDLHDELINFMSQVQTKNVCQTLHDKLGKEFIPRVELAPIRAVLNVIVLTTATAICAAILNLILK